jgi:hypothetical protein
MLQASLQDVYFILSKKDGRELDYWLAGWLACLKYLRARAESEVVVAFRCQRGLYSVTRGGAAA